MGKASVKVENGKMVNVEIDGSDVKITGDFFIEPAEAREQIEKALEDLEVVSEQNIVKKVKEVDAELIGFSAENVAEAFMEANE